MADPISIFSEIGTLKTVLLKCPGEECENLTPTIMNRLLFDDIPYLPEMIEQHNSFASLLRENGVNVLYFDDLIIESLGDENVKKEFITQILNESNLQSATVFKALNEYLNTLDNKTLVETVMAGVRKKTVPIHPSLLVDVVNDDNDYPFWMDPMPNLYFTRDFAASIGNGLTINHMTFQARRRDSLIMETIFRNHPYFKGAADKLWLDRNQPSHMEGGDEQILNDHTMAIGISQRSTADSILSLAKQLFSRKSGFDKIIAVKIPKSHALMHLDTVFTMVDYDKFTIYPEILANGGIIDIYILEPDVDGGVKTTYRNDLKKVLEEALEVPEIALIPTGNGDAIVAPREQWNDGSNTLAISPGTVVTYDRNYVSNKLLRSYGIKVLEITSSELCRGRGGPRCMSMPLVRDALKK